MFKLNILLVHYTLKFRSHIVTQMQFNSTHFHSVHEIGVLHYPLHAPGAQSIQREKKKTEQRDGCQRAKL